MTRISTSGKLLPEERSNLEGGSRLLGAINTNDYRGNLPLPGGGGKKEGGGLSPPSLRVAPECVMGTVIVSIESINFTTITIAFSLIYTVVHSPANLYNSLLKNGV